jgi:ATP-dependent exoDNAse (exonuclease V) beta subunit
MEELYQPFCGKMVTADLLKAIRKDTPMLTGAIARAFAEIFFKTDIVRPLTGQNFLIGEMIRKYVEKVLERDAKLTPFRYIESEKQIKCLFPLTDKSNIQLKGFIDRIDEVRDTVRIIDYKSGSGTTQFTSVEALFDKEDTDRSKAVMQVFMYAWMYGTVQLSTAIQPGIYYMRTLFSPSFDRNLPAYRPV